MIEAEAVKDILSAAWTAANTGDNTPIIDLVTNRVNVDIRNYDYVLTYNVGGGTAARVGAKAFSYSNRVSIDLRSSVWSRFKLNILEIMRIIEGKYLSPGGVYAKLVPLGKGVDLSDKTRLIYRRVIDVMVDEDLKELTSI